MADGYTRELPKGSQRITTGCQYCAVGCGYNAILVPLAPVSDTTAEPPTMDGVSRFITPAMRNTIRFRGKKYDAAVVPDVRCDLNKGNHSVRGGSQGENLVSANPGHRCTQDRLTSPKVRLANGKLKDITWCDLNQVMAKLVAHATDMKVVDEDFARRIRVNRPEGLGVKIFEYQYLENTFAATKFFYSAIGTPNVAYHDRPSAAGSSPGMKDAGLRPHDFSYDEVRESDVLVFIGTNPYENHSVFFMQYCQGKQIIVIDPRRTATAQYAEKTGGLHIQPKRLGADSLLLYALAREILVRWKSKHDLSRFPWRQRIADAARIEEFRHPVPNEIEKSRFARMRRASRAADFDSFATNFLEVGNSQSPYTLKKAAKAAGIDVGDLHKLLDMIFYAQEAHAAKQPKVGVFYEKGLIWGFNYHNTAAVASLGLLLGAYSEPGRFVGRVGGHQKGWAAAKIDLSSTFDNHRGTTGCGNEGYPFRNSEDRYSDQYLTGVFGKNATVKVHHNLDNHVFGVPPDFEDDSQDGVPRGFVRLKNRLVTKKNPDVRLLWIIGGNYLGQTNDSQRKYCDLLTRLKAGGGGEIKRPQKATVDEIVRVLCERMDAGRGKARGIVLVHQEILPNPTSELCDIMIPAAGWGEDTFCRYNAQRRLRLYDRFQDVPLDEKDVSRITGDPSQLWNDLKKYHHSPKPDWMIIRDIALALGREMDSGESTDFAKRMKDIFPWSTSSAVADDMAEFSIRGKAGGRLLSALLDYGRAHGLAKSVVHTVLGKDGNGESKYLKRDYESAKSKGGYEVADSDHATYGNGIASNGVMLPVALHVKNARRDENGNMVVRPETKLVGKLRNPPNGPFTFVTAHWKDIKDRFDEVNQASGDRDELYITNGRFNHLWNNMFHHLRNEYVNERYPEDLPGTILEINPDWAADPQRKIANGDVVEVTANGHRFLAVASLQESVPPEGAFAMFSYPARKKQEGKLVFNFDGYVNNITSGYADGIVPIGALKYGRAVVKKVGRYSSPRLQHPDVKKRPGPTYAPRNVIAPKTFDGDRAKWEMRELIVSKGLPRAALRRPFTAFSQEHGRFWSLPSTVVAFLATQIGHRGTVEETLIHALNRSMPCQMLRDGDFAEFGDFPATERNRLKRIAVLMERMIAKSGDDSPLAEMKYQLDALIDFPHRVVVNYFVQPDHFIELLSRNSAVRNRFAQRLSLGDARLMLWKEESGSVIDEWTREERAIAVRWLASWGTSPFDRVVQILNNAVCGASTDVRAHGAFWRGTDRDTFVDLEIRGLPLLIVGDGNNSNLIKALRGQAPFGKGLAPEPEGALYQRMPAGRPSVEPNDIQFIQDWIDDDCPVASTPNPNGGNLTMARKTSFKDHIVHMFRPIDVTRMAGIIDLEDYDAVKAGADNILDRISRGENEAGLMPPKDNGGPWPQEWIDLFKRWKDDGFPA